MGFLVLATLLGALTQPPEENLYSYVYSTGDRVDISYRIEDGVAFGVITHMDAAGQVVRRKVLHIPVPPDENPGLYVAILLTTDPVYKAGFIEPFVRETGIKAEPSVKRSDLAQQILHVSKVTEGSTIDEEEGLGTAIQITALGGRSTLARDVVLTKERIQAVLSERRENVEASLGTDMTKAASGTPMLSVAQRLSEQRRNIDRAITNGAPHEEVLRLISVYRMDAEAAARLARKFRNSDDFVRAVLRDAEIAGLIGNGLSELGDVAKDLDSIREEARERLTQIRKDNARAHRYAYLAGLLSQAKAAGMSEEEILYWKGELDSVLMLTDSGLADPSRIYPRDTIEPTPTHVASQDGCALVDVELTRHDPAVTRRFEEEWDAFRTSTPRPRREERISWLSGKLNEYSGCRIVSDRIVEMIAEIERQVPQELIHVRGYRSTSALGNPYYVSPHIRRNPITR